ncbi:acyltransferase [Maribacter sp.]|uniref:acyltransferase n=1 Tax=Maribacter sp. TaxID=1897614 RepID=UPI0025BDEE24|nr:acyltransferase [Maribacter sp.]
MILLIKTYLLYAKNLIDLGYNKFLFKFKKVSYQQFPKIKGKIMITGNGKLNLGKNISINSSRSANPIGGDIKTIIDLGTNGSLEINHSTGISNVTIIAHDSVTIGAFVKIGGSVKIYDTDFHSLDFALRKNKETDTAKTKPIIIKDNAFIGAHSIILKGVSVGVSSIIGAGSVVTKSVPDGEIWAGNPAKYIKKI